MTNGNEQNESGTVGELTSQAGESFRDSVSSIDKKGKRIWVFPKKPKGRFHRARVKVGMTLLALLFIIPFIKTNGGPIVLLDVINRKFIIFGIIFWPQDFYIFALAFLALILFIVLFTAVYGRLFCGWICPQTVFLELVFRKIEYWLEGDYVSQIKLKKSKWNFNKIWRKAFKQSIFFLISFILTLTLISYVIGADELFRTLKTPGSASFTSILATFVTAFVIYFIFSWFREQACTFVCPYARLQSVLLDRNSVIVAYDFKRGEPRTPPKLVKTGIKAGDCIDCSNCVRVCPTAIDIRNGVQLECVNCTACIDACDEIMDKVKKPRGLIRYTSLNRIETGKGFRFTPRIIIYTILLALLIILVGIFTFGRSNIEADILHAPGSLAQEQPDGTVVNLYTAKLLNKTYSPIPIEIKLDELQGEVIFPGRKTFIVEAGNLIETSFLIKLPKNAAKEKLMHIKLGIYSNGKLIQKSKTNFLGLEEHHKEHEKDED